MIFLIIFCAGLVVTNGFVCLVVARQLHAEHVAHRRHRRTR